MVAYYSSEDHARFVEQFKKSGMSPNAFSKSLKKPGVNSPGVTTLKKWLEAAGVPTDGPYRPDSGVPNGKAGNSLRAAFEKTLLPEDIEQKFTAYLEAQVIGLEGRVAELEDELKEFRAAAQLTK